MRLSFIVLCVSLVMFLASPAHAGMFDKILNSVKESPGAVIDAVDKAIDNQKPSPAKETTPVEAPLKPAAKPGKTTDPVLVINIQTRLNQLGYGTGSPDGICGGNTRKAIQDFEWQQGLVVTGEPTPSLLTLLDKAVQAKTKSNPGSQAQVLAKSDAGKSVSKEQKNEKAKSLADAEESKIVYEECVSDFRMSYHVDCECLAEKAAVLHAQINPEWTLKMRMNEYVMKVSQDGSCRNIPAAERQEYAKCMGGSGFDYRGIPQEDYCDCYAKTWAKLYGEHEGRIDSNIRSRISLKARMHCYKSLAAAAQ